jgi:hypothetical protein
VIKSRCPCCAPSWLWSQNGRVAVAQAKRTLGRSHISTCVLAPPSLNTPSVGRCSSQLSRSSVLACILDSNVAANVSTAPQVRLAGSEFSSRTCEKCAATTLRLLWHGTGAQKTATPTNYCTLARWHSRRRHDLPLIQHRERVGPSLAVLTAAQVSCSPEMTVRPLPKLSRWLAEPCSLAHDAISVGPPKIQQRTNGVSRAGVSGAPGPNCGNIPIPITTVVVSINGAMAMALLCFPHGAAVPSKPASIGRTVFVRLSENVSSGYRFPATNILSVDTGHFAQTYVYSSRTPHLAMAKVSTKVEHRA